MLRPFRYAFAGVLLITSIAFVTAISSEGFEKIPQELNVNDILPKSDINGENYTIADLVLNDGAINFYTFTSDHGDVEAEGIVQLNMRIAEFKAIAAMEEMDRKEVFGDALKSGLKAPVEGVKSLVKEPIETTKAAGRGIGQFMGNISRSIVSGGDPDQDNTLSVLTGYDVAKRQFAYDLNINPYTDNIIAREYLGQISKAAVAGGITPKVAMAAIDSTAVTVASLTATTQNMKKLVRDNPPGKLDKINREKLLAMGVSEGLTEAFLDNYRFDPFEETLLVGELEAMDGVDGRQRFIQIAVRADADSVAQYYRVTAMMFGAYHVNVEKIKEIQLLQNSGTAYIINKAGKLVVLAPVDYVFWTPELEEWLNKFSSDTKDKEFWVSGRFSEMARSQFEKRGYVVVENAKMKLLKDL